MFKNETLSKESRPRGRKRSLVAAVAFGVAALSAPQAAEARGHGIDWGRIGERAVERALDAGVRGGEDYLRERERANRDIRTAVFQACTRTTELGIRAAQRNMSALDYDAELTHIASRIRDVAGRNAEVLSRRDLAAFTNMDQMKSDLQARCGYTAPQSETAPLSK